MAADPIVDYHNVQWDAQGKPFWVTQSGRRSYIPPAIAGQTRDNPRLLQWAASQGYALSRDASGNATGVVSDGVPQSGFAKGRGEWNPGTGQYDQHLNQGGLGGLLEGGAALAAPMFVGPAIAGVAGGGAPAATTLTSSVIPASAVPGAATTTAAAGVGTASGWDALKKAFTSPTDLARLAALIPAIRSAAGGSSSGGADTGGLLDDVRQGLSMQRDRMTQAQPVYDALIRQAMGTTPTRYRSDAPATNGGPAYAYTPPTFGGR